MQRELQAACCIEYNWLNILITSFLEFARSGAPKMKESAASVLGFLATNGVHQTTIISENGIQVLVDLAKRGDPAVRAEALETLKKLAVSDAVKRAIAAAGLMI